MESVDAGAGRDDRADRFGDVLPRRIEVAEAGLRQREIARRRSATCAGCSSWRTRRRAARSPAQVQSRPRRRCRPVRIRAAASRTTPLTADAEPRRYGRRPRRQSRAPAASPARPLGRRHHASSVVPSALLLWKPRARVQVELGAFPRTDDRAAFGTDDGRRRVTPLFGRVECVDAIARAVEANARGTFGTTVPIRSRSGRRRRRWSPAPRRCCACRDGRASRCDTARPPGSCRCGAGRRPCSAPSGRPSASTAGATTFAPVTKR